MKALILAALLAAFFIMETAFPFFRGRKLKTRLIHYLKNAGFGSFNGLLAILLFTYPLKHLFDFISEKHLGLLSIIELPVIIKIIAAVILFDLWMYAWHLANHNVTFLWLFHRMHHSDNRLDAASAVRFHTGEILISGVLRFPVYLLIGMSPEMIMIYEICFAASTVFIHGNINLPERIDRVLRIILTTPNMHRVHHSDIYEETNSNYTNFLSLWDRLFGTFRLREDYSKINLGLKEFRDEKKLSLVGMIITPFIKIK